MRGTKLLAWQTPPLWKSVLAGSSKEIGGSSVLREQRRLLRATNRTLVAIAEDVRTGLLETVGLKCTLAVEERCSIVLEMPPGTDNELIARAIDVENIEAWCDDNRRVHVGIGPWYSTKDVDQVVLTVTKVVHVLLGIHAADTAPPIGLMQRLLLSVREILMLEKNLAQKKD